MFRKKRGVEDQSPVRISRSGLRGGQLGVEGKQLANRAASLIVLRDENRLRTRNSASYTLIGNGNSTLIVIWISSRSSRTCCAMTAPNSSLSSSS